MIRRGQFCNISGGIISFIVLMTERRGCCVFAPMAAYLDKDDYNDKDNIDSYYNDETHDIENDVNDYVDLDMIWYDLDLIWYMMQWG